MNVLIDNYNAACYLKERGISGQFIYLIVGRDTENNLYYLVTAPGLSRWQTNLEFVVPNKGFWLSKEFAEDILKVLSRKPPVILCFGRDGAQKIIDMTGGNQSQQGVLRPVSIPA